MKTPTLSAELKTVLKKLKLGQIIATLPDRMVLAEKQQLSLDETLLLVLSDEVTRRDSTACTRRAAKAGLDPEMMIERWDTTSKIRYDKRVLAELMSLRFVEASKNAVILGAVGVGEDFPRQRSRARRNTTWVQRDLHAGGRDAAPTQTESTRQLS